MHLKGNVLLMSNIAKRFSIAFSKCVLVVRFGCAFLYLLINFNVGFWKFVFYFQNNYTVDGASAFSQCVFASKAFSKCVFAIAFFLPKYSKYL
jgi:hypothetical protein